MHARAPKPGRHLSLVALLLLAVCLSCWAQPNVPTDPALDNAISGLIMSLQFSLTGGGIMLPILEAQLSFRQSLLFSYQIMADDALLTAWTTWTLVDMQRSLHQSVAAARYVVQKLEADIAWYEDEYSVFAMPNYTPDTTARERLYNKYRQLKSIVAVVKPQVEQAAEDVLAVFGEVRRRIQSGSYGRPSLKLDSRKIVEALLAYREVMARVEDELEEKVYKPRLTPERQLRLLLTNDSADLVFFFRVSERDGQGGYPQPREDTKGWLPLYPRGFGVELDDRSGKKVTANLPNELWLPAKLMDQVQIRVATVGETRGRIRFMGFAPGGQARPELNSLQRGFYYLGYWVPQPPAKIISHWYPTEESYQWHFTGGWGAEVPSFMPTDIEELRDQGVPYDLTLSQDHVAWRVPGFLEDIKNEPECRATVQGSATFEKRGPRSDSPKHTFNETGSGTLTVMMEVW